MSRNRQKVTNIGKSKPQTEKQTIAIAKRQIWQSKFNPAYDQVVKRISVVPFHGLRFGQPYGTVQ